MDGPLNIVGECLANLRTSIQSQKLAQESVETSEDTYIQINAEGAVCLAIFITAGISTVDMMGREAIYQEFQALMLEHLPYIYIGYLTPPIFVNKRVQNVEIYGTAGGRINLREVWLSE